MEPFHGLVRYMPARGAPTFDPVGRMQLIMNLKSLGHELRGQVDGTRAGVLPKTVDKSYPCCLSEFSSFAPGHLAIAKCNTPQASVLGTCRWPHRGRDKWQREKEISFYCWSEARQG